MDRTLRCDVCGALFLGVDVVLNLADGRRVHMWCQRDGMVWLKKTA